MSLDGFRIGYVMNDVYILSAVRTPIGKFGGSLASMTAADMGVVAAKAAMERAGVRPIKSKKRYSATPARPAAAPIPPAKFPFAAAFRRKFPLTP